MRPEKRHLISRQAAFVCLLFFLCFSINGFGQESNCSCTGKLTKTEKGTCTIAGTINSPVFPNGIKGPTILIYKGNILVAKCTSGKNGKYSVAKLPEGNYEIKVCPSNGSPVCIPGVYTQKDKTTFINIFLNT